MYYYNNDITRVVSIITKYLKVYYSKKLYNDSNYSSMLSYENTE